MELSSAEQRLPERGKTADDSLWREMRKKCDQIGYCCFTPTPDSHAA